MNIQGFQKTTLLDYPKHVAATVFWGGCNFRCPFCHNGNLVLSPNLSTQIPQEEILSYLMKRKNILDGVCITGGEPTLQKELASFLDSIKQIGLSIKLDTNGYRPDILKSLCQNGLVDYVAMDIKGSPLKYAAICGLDQMDFSNIEASVDFLLQGSVDYEFRTTVMKEFHNLEDFREIGSFIKGAKSYYLQGYQDSPHILSGNFTAYTYQELLTFQTLLKNYISTVEIRGVEQ